MLSKKGAIHIKLKTLKQKLLCLFERIKLSESEYKNIKSKAQMYDDMISTINFDMTTVSEDVRDKRGNVIYRHTKQKTGNANIDIVKMLNAGGIIFNLDAVKLNVAK